jgi:hypothetical protein
LGNFLGEKHTVGFKPEAAPGTPEATVTAFMVSEGLDMYAHPTAIERKSFLGTGVELPSRSGWIMPGGSVPAEVLASQPQPWYWLLGHVVTTQPAVSTDPTVYLHTISDDALAVSKQNASDSVSLTAEGNRVFDACKQAGVKLNQIKLSVVPGEVGKIELQWSALTHTDGATLTSIPAFLTDSLDCKSVAVSLAGSPDLTVTTADVTIDVGHEQLPTLVAGGAGHPQVIRRKDRLGVSGSIGWLDYPAAQLAKFVAATTFALVIELQGDTISNTYKKFLRITLPACQYSGGLEPSIAEGVITGDATFKANYDTSTGLQVKVEAQNTVATINT